MLLFQSKIPFSTSLISLTLYRYSSRSPLLFTLEVIKSVKQTYRRRTNEQRDQDQQREDDDGAWMQLFVIDGWPCCIRKNLKATYAHECRQLTAEKISKNIAMIKLRKHVTQNAMLQIFSFILFNQRDKTKSLSYSLTFSFLSLYLVTMKPQKLWSHKVVLVSIFCFEKNMKRCNWTPESRFSEFSHEYVTVHSKGTSV